MDKQLEIVEDVFIVLGVALSIDQIKTILGIVLLVIQISLILFKGVKLIVKHVKNKELDEIEKVIDQTTKEIQDIIDSQEDDNKNSK